MRETESLVAQGDHRFNAARVLSWLIGSNQNGTLAWVIPRLWVTAPLFQIGSLLSYLGYFQLSVHGPAYGLLPVTFGVGTLALEYVRAQIRSSVSIRDVFPLRRWVDHVNLRWRSEHGPAGHVER